MYDNYDVTLYFEFIPAVCKSWLKKHKIYLSKYDFEDLVSELYFQTKQPRFNNVNYILNPELFFVMLYILIPNVLKKLFPSEVLMEEHDIEQYSEKEQQKDEIKIEDKYFTVVYEIWTNKKDIKQIAMEYKVSISTVYSWIRRVKRMIKNIYEEELKNCGDIKNI